MGLFGNSFSDVAVSRAVDWLKEIDRESVSYVQFLSPEIYNEIFNFSNVSDFDDRQKKLWFAKNEFFTAVVQEILEYFFDGKPRDFEKYETTVLRDAFNFGFLANYAKSYGKMLKQSRRNQSETHRKGAKWFNEYFRDMCISTNKRLSELEEEKNAEEELRYQELLNEQEITNSEKFLENFVDDEDRRFSFYEGLINYERNSNFSLEFQEYTDSIKEKQYEVQESVSYEFGNFITPQLSLQLCVTGQKILTSCGFNTEILLSLRKYNGEFFEEIESINFHKFGKIITQQNGFSLNDISFPEPVNLDEALLLRESGNQIYQLQVDMRSKSKDTLNDQILIGMSCNFHLSPLAQSNQKTFMDEVYEDLSNSEDRIDGYKADVIADLLVNRKSLIDKFIRLHRSWGDDRKKLYDEFRKMDLEDVSSEIRQHVNFHLASNSSIHIYSTSTLYGGERPDFYEKSGSFFDDFDAKIVSRLGLLNSRECPNKVDNLENRLSPSLYFIMYMERLLAAYTNFGKEGGFTSLFAEITDENSLDLDSLLLW